MRCPYFCLTRRGWREHPDEPGSLQFSSQPAETVGAYPLLLGKVTIMQLAGPLLRHPGKKLSFLYRNKELGYLIQAPKMAGSKEEKASGVLPSHSAEGKILGILLTSPAGKQATVVGNLSDFLSIRFPHSVYTPLRLAQRT